MCRYKDTKLSVLAGVGHHFVEWEVDTMLESDMAHAYLTESNRGMTATDTQKNTVYYVAKQMKEPCSPEEYALALLLIL
jgi:urate oxidase